MAGGGKSSSSLSDWVGERQLPMVSGGSTATATATATATTTQNQQHRRVPDDTAAQSVLNRCYGDGRTEGGMWIYRRGCWCFGHRVDRGDGPGWWGLGRGGGGYGVHGMAKAKVEGEGLGEGFVGEGFVGDVVRGRPKGKKVVQGHG